MNSSIKNYPFCKNQISIHSFGSLNPLTISHTPINTSHKPPGIEETSPSPDPIIADTIPQKMVAYPTMPHKASHCGTSLVLFNVKQSINPASPSEIIPISYAYCCECANNVLKD